MNYYELRKKVAARSEGYPECKTNSEYRQAHDIDRQRLACHKSRNFDKALEALKEAQSYRGQTHHGTDKCIVMLRETIAKLETVEGL